MYSKYKTTLLKISTPKYPFQKFCFKGECGENLGDVCNERGRRVFRFLCSKMGVKSAQESLLSQALRSIEYKTKALGSKELISIQVTKQ